ncbi:hypothetical protein GXN76_07790 [Kroppenstedtia pulmonis]|uniref:Uncharacterized protein n=1 Tax=Kroppenstedtia pulmonis TaxID=1380685 RepID=A0A7D3XRN0_9BACL|nr:hypothetical protein [Kroppenstedtia pulmonis]QKG84388.1 hypothetical protein GXN76_07790 [Kroppenstedtia pulmonis]
MKGDFDAKLTNWFFQRKNKPANYRLTYESLGLQLGALDLPNQTIPLKSKGEGRFITGPLLSIISIKEARDNLELLPILDISDFFFQIA